MLNWIATSKKFFNSSYQINGPAKLDQPDRFLRVILMLFVNVYFNITLAIFACISNYTSIPFLDMRTELVKT